MPDPAFTQPQKRYLRGLQAACLKEIEQQRAHTKQLELRVSSLEAEQDRVTSAAASALADPDVRSAKGFASRILHRSKK